MSMLRKKENDHRDRLLGREVRKLKKKKKKNYTLLKYCFQIDRGPYTTLD